MGRKNIDPATIKSTVAGSTDAADGGGMISSQQEVLPSINDSSSINVAIAKNNLASTLGTFAQTVKSFNTMLDDVATKFENVDAQLSSEIDSASDKSSGKQKSYSKASSVK